MILRLSNCLLRHTIIKPRFSTTLSFRKWSSSRQDGTLYSLPQRQTISESKGYTPMLSKQQVTVVLEAHQNSVEIISEGPIKSFETNQLASNSPIEDRHAEASLIQTPGMLFAVMDGHAGCACAQALSERLLEYIAVTLLPIEKLEEYCRHSRTDDPMPILKGYVSDNQYRSQELGELYKTSLQKFAVETLSTSALDEFYMADAIESVFLRLDNDISSEALPTSGILNTETLNIAMSGSCACLAHVEGPHLHIANVGDTRAVLGTLDERGEWIAHVMTNDHNCLNVQEVQRIKSEHPISESTYVLRHERLLGQLVPLRAFGDFRYKWPIQELKKIITILKSPYAHTIMPPNYYTPPYLTCQPDVIYHRLSARDKFLILASDGLWDCLQPDHVVKLIGEYMQGKQTVEHFTPMESMTLGQLKDVLKERQTGLANKTLDSNVATHLLRNALGLEHNKVSEMLMYPHDVVRNYRDDITITVVYFNADFLRSCPGDLSV